MLDRLRRWVECESPTYDAVAVEAAGRLVAAVVVEVMCGLLVEAGFLEQAPGGVVLEAGGAVVFVAQFDQLAEAVPAVIEGCAVGIKALLDQPGFVVGQVSDGSFIERHFYLVS